MHLLVPSVDIEGIYLDSLGLHCVYSTLIPDTVGISVLRIFHNEWGG